MKGNHPSQLRDSDRRRKERQTIFIDKTGPGTLSEEFNWRQTVIWLRCECFPILKHAQNSLYSVSRVGVIRSPRECKYTQCGKPQTFFEPFLNCLIVRSVVMPCGFFVMKGLLNITISSKACQISRSVNKATVWLPQLNNN
jgi:hypothetical protein